MRRLGRHRSVRAAKPAKQSMVTKTNQPKRLPRGLRGLHPYTREFRKTRPKVLRNKARPYRKHRARRVTDKFKPFRVQKTNLLTYRQAARKRKGF